MYRVKRLDILAGFLALTCAAAVWALHQEERQEQIASSGETVLEIDPDTVRSLSWEYDGETLSFHRDGPWIYDSDEAFPVSGDSMQELLETFRQLSAEGQREILSFAAYKRMIEVSPSIKLSPGQEKK